MPTYTTTAKRALRWLQGGNLVSDIDAGFQALAEDVDAQFGSIGKSIIATSEARTNTAYGLLTTPDRVQSVVLPTDGLIQVFFHALWKGNGSNTIAAAVFIGSNQLKIGKGLGPPVTQAAATPTTDSNWMNVASASWGLVTGLSAGFDATSVTTGQVVGSTPLATQNLGHELDGTLRGLPTDLPVGGPAYIFAAAGTYDISVQFKASANAVTVKERKLWVRALPF